MWVALDWIERHCIVPDGFRKGQPFRLYEGQGQYLANFYLVRGDAPWIPENPVLGPAFVYRRGLLVGPQKLGKNPLIAAQICLEGAGPALFAGHAGSDEGYACRDNGCRCGWEYAYDPGEPMGMLWPTPLIQITAFSQESTDNTYDALRPMIDDGPLHDLIPKTGEAFIRLPGGGRVDTVTSSAPSRLGQRVTFVPQDEVGIYTVQNKMAKLADTQYRGLSGMGGRASLTSNAWDPAENSVAQQQFESPATDIYRQFVQPPKTLSYADRRDRRKIHRIVYPSDVLRENGGHLDLDAIENEAADLVERDPQQAMRFYGNILVAGAGHAVDPDRWDQLARPGVKPPPGTRVGGGFDGSISQDATLIRGCTPEGHGFIWQAWERPTGPELLRWLADHPGKTQWEVDRLEVDRSFTAFMTTYDVGLVNCDTPKWRTEIEGWAEKWGEEVVIAFDTNVARRFAPAVDRWLTAIAQGTHTHDADPITDAHVKAAHKQKVRLADHEDDGRTMYILVKGSDKRRIDGAVTDVLAHEAAMTMPAAATVVASVYNDPNESLFL
jgi:hypothetical protein